MRIIEGVEIIINECPHKWSSRLKGARPMELRYPIQGIITKILQVHPDGTVFNVLINHKEYGFSLEHMNDFDLITL